MPEILLKDQRVLITGGTGKLGGELVRAFTGAGAKVAVHYNKSVCHSRESGNPVYSRDPRLRGDDSFADLRDIGQIEKTVSAAVESLGGLDILINSAAIFGKTPIESATPEQWDDLLNINLRAPFFLSKFAVPFLRKSGHGRIINIADTYGASPSSGFVPYGVSKAGLIAMTIGLAKEFAPDVLVNCVCPGVRGFGVRGSEFGVRGSGVGGRGSGFGGRGSGFDVGEGLCPLPNVEKAINATLLKRPVAIDDVIKTVLFLAGNNSMTGQAVFVDCGKNV